MRPRIYVVFAELFGDGWLHAHSLDGYRTSEQIPRPPGDTAESTLRHGYGPTQTWIDADTGLTESFTPRIERIDRRPGDFHPRLDRPGGPFHRQYAHHEWASAVGAAANLFAGMRDVFRVIEPDRANAKAFGHRTRELLLLAAMEVESGWKAVLRANNYPPSLSGRFSTNDYVKLLAPMRLEEWGVELSAHPSWGMIYPFKGWSSNAPTQSLGWYDAYNAVKHDRETDFSRASLEQAVTALAAVFVMVKAQFGSFDYQPYSGDEGQDFRAVWLPNWSPSELYLSPALVNGGSYRATTLWP